MRILSLPILVLTFVAIAACTDKDEVVITPAASPQAKSSDPATKPTPSPGLEVVNLEADPAIWVADSVKSLVQGYEVITGRVTGIALPYDPRVGYGGVAPPTPPPEANPLKNMTPTEEEINRPPGRLYTVWAFEVIDPGSTGFKPGDTVNIAKSGGDWEGKRYQLLGNPLFDVGHSYLLPIKRDEVVSSDLHGDGYFAGASFAQFIIDDGATHPIYDGWSDLPGVRALSGQSVDSALQEMKQAKSDPIDEATPSE